MAAEYVVTTTEGLFIAGGTVVGMFLLSYACVSVASWDSWFRDNCGESKWMLLMWIFVRLLRIVLFPISIVLTLLGMYTVATVARDFWHKK